MRKIIKSPIKQVVWARIYIVSSLLSSVLLAAWVTAYFFVLDRGELVFGIIALILCVLLLGSGVFVAISFWKTAWSKIVICDDKISVVCPFAREISLNVGEVRKLAVRQEGDTKFVLMTNERNLPYKETEKIQTEDGLIKFFLTDELKNALLMILPQALTKPLRKN